MSGNTYTMASNEFTAPQIIVKQPGEKRKLSMDFTNWIGTAVTLSSPTITSELIGGDTSDLSITSISVSGKKILFFVEGGTHAKNYNIQVTVTTSEGETLIGDGMLRVINK